MAITEPIEHSSTSCWTNACGCGLCTLWRIDRRERDRRRQDRQTGDRRASCAQEPDPFDGANRASEAEHRVRAVERALAPKQQWVEAQAAERPRPWRALADAVTDERIVYPAAIGWMAGILAAAAWDESWVRILLTGALVAGAAAVFGAVRARRATRAAPGASPGSTADRGST
jgi:hypothetical protein